MQNWAPCFGDIQSGTSVLKPLTTTSQNEHQKSFNEAQVLGVSVLDVSLFLMALMVLVFGCQFNEFNITLRFVLVDMIQKGFRFITHSEVQIAPL